MSGPDAGPDSLRLPVPRALFRLALPILASQVLRLAFQWVDALWVRGLGVDATAAITTSVFVMWAVLSLYDVFGFGIGAYVSQLVGAGERRRAGLAAWKGLRASAAMGLAGVVAGLFFARPIYSLVTTDPGVVEAGASYLRIVLLGTPLIMMSLSCESVLRACGDTRTPFLVDLFAVTLNALLAPVLIYGLGPFPRMGVAGAATATVAAQAVMLGCYATFALRRHPSLPLARSAEGPPLRVLGMAKVGLPAASIGLLFSLVYIAFTRAASQWGPAAVAVVGIVNRVEAIQFVVSAAIGFAAATMVGQSLGAGASARAEETIRTGQRWALLFSLALTALYLIWPRLFLAMFTRDPQVLALGTPYMRVIALTLVATGLEIVTAEAVMGSGHTLAVSWIYTIVSLARIPLAMLVPRWTGGGLQSIAWLITLTCVVRTGAILMWAARGTWKRGLATELHGHAATATAEDPGAAV
ncbi:MAG: MATE family efflux transporter [Candidatus Eisenbacteria bacterium]|nr:MATE family efflux transporter [Candidatus Eisenbacteria bacterium]